MTLAALIARLTPAWWASYAKELEDHLEDHQRHLAAIAAIKAAHRGEHWPDPRDTAEGDEW